MTTNEHNLNDGGPAFPVLPTPGVNYVITGTGMTLRDYFAVKALVGIMAETMRHPSVTRDDIVGAAYAYADAMLKARQS